MAEKQLLIESCDFSFSVKEDNELKESLRLSAGKNDTLIVKGIPSTICNFKNQNGRVYPTALMQKAIEAAKPKMNRRELNSQACEHPDQSLVTPTNVSHTIINAYIKNVEVEVDGKKVRHDVLFTDWLVLPTRDGTTLMTLLKNGVSVPVSIRGLGSCDENGIVDDYEFLGVDCVANASSKVHSTMYVSESVEVSTVPLTETYIVSASATNVVRDLDQALALSQQIDSANFGTVKKTSTKLDSEVDPKTGAETTMVTLETETEDEVSELDQALAMAKQAMMNGKADIDSVTIENVKEEQPKESVENSEAPLNEDEYIPESEMDDSMGTISGEYKANQVGSPEKRAERAVQMQYNFIVGNTQEADPERQQAENIFAKFEQGQASAIDTREALYNIASGLQKKLWGESKDTEYNTHEFTPKGVDWIHDSVISLMWNDGLTLEQACRKFCEQNDNIPYDYLLEYMRTAPVEESMMTEEALKAILSYALGIDGWYHAKLGGSLANLQYIDKQLNKLIKTYHMLVTDRGELYIDFDYMKEDEMNRLLKALQDKLHVRLDVYNPTADLQGESVKESTNDPVFNAKSSFTAISAYHQHCNDVPGIEEIYTQAKEVMDKLEQKEIDAVKGAEILDKLHHEGIQKILHHGFGESAITEAKEEKQEDPNKGKQYVLKTNQGFVAMDGNAISFVDNPKDAIHFVKGNEESGVIHLSGINKILNTMGILDSDIEKYFKKDSIDISAHDDVNVQAAESDGVKVEECGTTPMTEENGSNTRFKATIKINGANGESTEDVPVSAVDMEGINAEVANLYDMKKQKADGELVITVTDTASGQQFILNPETRQIEPMNAQMESAGDIEQDGNKLSMEVDDDNKVEKEFDTPAQAAVAKAGIESGKLGGDVLLSEDNNQYNDPMLYMNDIHDFLLSGGNISDEDMDKVWSIFNNWRDEKIPTKDACDQLEVIRKQIIDNTPNIMYSDNPISEADDEESDTAKCAWCGEEFEKSALRKEKDLGYLCNTCARGIASREGSLTFEEADNEIPVKTDYNYENIEPGWYASAPSIGFVGPYDTEEELRSVLGKEVCEIADSDKGLVNIDHVEDDDALAAESTKIDEVMFNEPGEASDPFVEKPLKDSVGNVMVEVDNINWNNEDLYNNFLANYEPGDPVSFGDVESKVKDLPSSAVIKINMDELPDDVDIHTFKDCVLDSLGKTYAMKVNDADIISVNYIN